MGSSRWWCVDDLGDDLGGESAAGGLGAGQVPGGGGEAGDVEQRAVGDAAAEQRARRGHRVGGEGRRLRNH